jgi:hypothetical protein
MEGRDPTMWGLIFWFCLLIAGVLFFAFQLVDNRTLRGVLVGIALFAIVGAGLAGAASITPG